MALVSILAQADIRNHQQAGHLLLERTHGLLHDAVLVVRTGARAVLGFRNAKENHSGNTKSPDRFALLDQAVDRKLRHSWHAGNGVSHPRPRHHKERHHQIVDAEPRLSHHAAEIFVLPQTSWPVSGEFHAVSSLSAGFARSPKPNVNSPK